MATTAKLTTTTRLESELGITLDADQLTWAASAIDEVSAACARFVGFPLTYLAAAVERVQGHDAVLAFVRRTPVRSLTALDWVDVDGNETDLTLDGVEIMDIDDETGFGRTGAIRRNSGWSSASVRSGVRQSPVPGSSRQAYKLTFAGGWVTAQQAADDVTLTRDLPFDIEAAALIEVVARFRRRGRDPGVKSERALDGAVTYESDEAKRYGLNTTTLGMLRTYKRTAGGF